MGKDIKKQPQPNKGSGGWRAVNPTQFKSTFNEIVPCYAELSEGKTVQLDTNDEQVKSWISKKIITKE